MKSKVSTSLRAEECESVVWKADRAAAMRSSHLAVVGGAGVARTEKQACFSDVGLKCLQMRGEINARFTRPGLLQCWEKAILGIWCCCDCHRISHSLVGKTCYPPNTSQL